MQEPTPPDLGGLSSVFFAIHLAGGHIGLPILVATFVFSKTAKRPLTVINFCIIWIFYSVIYCILLYGGNNLLHNPPFELCLAQAAMNYAAPPMAVVAGLEVVLQIWSTFVEPWKEARLAHIPRWLKAVAIIIPPYLAFIAFAVSAAVDGLRNPEWVAVKNGLYCGLLHGKFEMFAVPVFCLIFLALIIGFEVATGLAFWRNRKTIMKDFPLVAAKRPSLSPLCRAGLFLIYASLTLGVCIMDLKQDMGAFAYMIQAALPLAAFIVFSSQKDVAVAWIFWFRKPQWRPEDDRRPSIGSIDSRQNPRPVSQISQITIESSTPIATHFSASMV